MTGPRFRGVAERLDRIAARIKMLQPQQLSDMQVQRAVSQLFDVVAQHLPLGTGGRHPNHDKAALRAAAARIAAGEPTEADAALLAALPRADLRATGWTAAEFVAEVANLPDQLTPELEAELQAFAANVRG